MKTLKLKTYPNHNNETFLLIRKHSDFHQLGSAYQLLEYGTEMPIKKVVLVHCEKVHINELNSLHSYLAKDTNPRVLREILTNYDTDENRTKFVDLLVFHTYSSNVENNPNND